MKNTFLILILSLAVFAAGSAQAGTVKSEEEFDRKAGLFNRTWKQAPKVTHFTSPVPAQVRPVLPPWSQQPQGAQSAGGTGGSGGSTGFIYTPGP